MQFRSTLIPAIAILALTACEAQPQEEPDGAATQEPEPTATATQTPEATESVSILRPDIAPPRPDAETQALDPFEAVIGFPEGGDELSDDAIAKLEEVLASPQLALNGPITLSAHSDTQGTDAANLRASEERGLAVAQWLTDKGVDPDRITVIAFGEQNPVEPNALPDGSPNETGRAANRRVEIEVLTLPPTVTTTEESKEGEVSVEARD